MAAVKNPMRDMLRGELEDQRVMRPEVRNYGPVSRPKPTERFDGRSGTDVPTDFNPLLDDLNGLPRFDKVQPQHLVSGMHMAVDQFGKDLEKLQGDLHVAVAKPWRMKWAKFAEPLELLLDRVDRAWGAVGLLRDATGGMSPEFHKAYNELIPLLTEVSLILGQSTDIYQALKLLSKQPDLTDAQYRIVQWFMRDAWQSGVGLEDASVAKRFSLNMHELSYLATVFTDNVARGEQQELRLLTNEDEVAGFPADALADAAAASRAAGHESASAERGPWMVTPTPSVCQAVLEQSNDRGLREEVYRACSRLGWRSDTGEASGGRGDNGWVVARMLQLRQEWARSLGYESFAEMAFDSRSAPQRQVEIVLQSLHNASEPAARAELEELRASAARGGAEGELQPWDVAFWRRRLREDEVASDAAAAALPLPSVLRALFGLVERLFGVKISDAGDEAAVWDDMVGFFRVSDARTLNPIGAFYLDPFRAERKNRQGFFTELALSYSKLLGKYGTPRRPIVHIVGDIRPPDEEDGEVMLDFRQVQSLFRAMGDALQELLTEQEEGLAAGSRCKELDAIGFPGLFLELWASEPSTLDALGRPEAAEALMVLERFHSGSRLLEEVRLAQVDLELHSGFDAGAGAESPLVAARRVEERSSQALLKSGEERELCSFLEPFATGHASGYYANLWARVLAADAFDAFQELGEDEEAVRGLGLKLRSVVLAPGGGLAGLAAFRDFLGRNPRLAPLLRRLGLKRPAPPTPSPPA